MKNKTQFLFVTVILSVLSLGGGCGKTELENQLIGYYNLSAMELDVVDTSINYLPPFTIFFLEDKTFQMPLREDLPFKNIYNSTWEIVRTKKSWGVKIISSDSLFDQIFDLHIKSYHYSGGKQVSLKEFTLINDHVYLNAYIE